MKVFAGSRTISCTSVLGGVALTVVLAPAHTAMAGQLPVPCFTGTCAPNKTPGFNYPGTGGTVTGPTGFVQSGQASATQSGNTLTVTQSSNQAILNWSSFNISAAGQVIFLQPSSTSVALNKIYQASPSSIFGTLTANGQIYLINPNGFVFGSTAQVNVGGLMASSLGLYGGDADLANGITSEAANARPALQSDSRIYVTDANGNPLLDAGGNPQLVQIQVQQGASITAADGGRILLVGQQVTNGGTLTAPDGQIVLAAGQAVYLQSSTDVSLRGLVVEVNNSAVDSNNQPLPNAATSPFLGTVANLSGGELSAPRGNVSLIGYAVNQSGRISATTAVSANGSVILQAAQGAAPGTGACDNGQAICATAGGTLTLGPSSDIEVLPEIADTTTTAAVAQPQVQSSVQLTGESVYLKGGQIRAPGGSLNVLAAADPNAGLQTEGNTAAQIRVAAGTNIDLAGSDAQLPMSDNLLSLQLRGNELEDDPDQRNGALHGDTVIVNLQDGRPPIVSDASWQAALQGVQEDVAQRTSAGGSANFKSEGDLVVSQGSSINVSGGQWNYAAGAIQTSQLIGSNGQTYSIETANPSLAYTGVFNPTYTQNYNGFGVQLTGPTPGLYHIEPGYVQGFSAGTVNLTAPAMVVQGTLLGSAVDGPYQRSASGIPAESFAPLAANNGTFPTSGAAAMATGGQLVIGAPLGAQNSAGLPYFFAPGVTFTSGSDLTPTVVADGAPLPPQTLQLPTSYLTSGGFSSTEIFSDATVTLPTGLPLNLGAGGSLLVVAPRINVDSSIQALGGAINLEAAQSADFSSTMRTGIDIADGVTLDVRGQWTNDSTFAPTSAMTATWQNGGSITLSLSPDNSVLPQSIAAFLPKGTNSLSPLTSGGELLLGDDVNLLASGGAWLQSNNTLTGGEGGQITLDASPYQSALRVGSHVSVSAFGVQGAAGGSFTLEAPRILVDGDLDWSGAQQVDYMHGIGSEFDVGAGLFSQDGFSNVTLVATAPAVSVNNADMLTVASGTTIEASAQSWQLSGDLAQPTGGTAQVFAQPQLLPASNQTPFTVSLQAIPAGTDPAPSALGVTNVGNIDILPGASIVAGPGGTTGSSIDLASQGSILIDGTLSAPGGAITAHIEDPTSPFDPGLLPGQRLELGGSAVLDVSGTTVLAPNAQGLPLGSVLPGGSVDLIADRGDVIVDGPAAATNGTVATPGALIDIAGSSGSLDVLSGTESGYTRTTSGSSGGSLLISAGESVSMLGNLRAQAGGGSAASGTLDGGRFELDLHSAVLPNFTASAPAEIELVTDTTGLQPSVATTDTAVLGVSELTGSGIGALTLSVGGPYAGGVSGIIRFDTATPLSLGREVVLDAPVLAVGPGIPATVNAPYVAVTDSQQLTGAATGTVGSGALTLNAQEITLAGYTAVQGAGTVTLNSSGDVQFEPLSATQLGGGLNFAGNLDISAARLFPATLASYAIDDQAVDAAGNPIGSVSIAQNGTSPGVPLSVGGSLSINAPTINDDGTMLAPFGDLSLQAAYVLNLGASSVTSVSADGAVLPFGQTTLGQQEWVYVAGNATLPVTGLPTPNGNQGRTVSLSAPYVSLASGAVVDVSGGGDLSAYEWVPGLGGSTDALGQAQAVKNGLYAVLPGTQGQYPAFDLQEFSGSNVAPGQSVYLSGITGLPAGYYPLLPARDALLPGAYLIQAEPGYQSLTGGTLGALADGTPVVAGYYSFGNTGQRTSAGYTGFAIWSGSYSQQLAQYDTSYASSIFAPTTTAAPQTPVPLPVDAGTLQIAVGQSLNVAGTVETAAAKGGTAATVDIYTTGAGDITVAGTDAPAGSGLVLNAATLQSWDAGDLILGGQLQADGSLNVTAGSITFAPGASLSAGQVLAVANNAIDVQAGAHIASDSGDSGAAPTTSPQAQPITLQQSGAALLAVSDTALPLPVRNGAGSSGSIDVESGATLRTLGAVSLDAPGGVSISDQATIHAPGASWSLASNSIAFTGGAATSDSLAIDPTLLTLLQGAGTVRLASGGAIDLLAPVSLGATGTTAPPTLRSLTLVASDINNAGGSSIFGGDAVVLTGTGSGSSAPATAAGGTLAVIGNSIDFGGTGALAVIGDNQTTFATTGSMTGHQVGQLNVNGGALVITAAQLTATSQSSASVTASSGSLAIQQSGTAAAPANLLTSLGGGLSLSATSIQDSGSITVPGGRIGLQATGGDVTVASGAQIDAGGLAVTAMNQTHGAPGGIVDISATGNLTLAPGATVNVAGAYDAPGGSLTLNAGGDASIGATLSAGAGPAAASGAAGGSFMLYAGGRLSGGLSSTLVNTLGSGGFSNTIGIEVGGGDLNLAASGCAAGACVLRANQVTLSADSGSIDIGGTIDTPSAALLGSIGLFAANNVTLEGGGALHADGNGPTGRGGEVELSADSGNINLDAGSVISAQGAAQSGSMLLRVAAVGNDVAIGNIGADVSRVGTVIVEPVLPTYDYATVGDFTGNFAQIQSGVRSYAAAAQANVTGRLDTWSTGPSFVFEPGVVIEDHDPSSAMDLQQALNLKQALGMPVDLTVRSAGGIEIDGNISDGENNNQLFAAGTASSSLRFVAGANLSSANPLAVNVGAPADLILGAGAIVQTGTGDLDLVAARDVQFGAGSTAYTTGTAPQGGVSNQKVKGGGSNITLTFATNGGNVVVDAGRDVAGGGTVGGIADWLGRTTVNGGAGVSLGAWGVNLAAFDQNPWNVATFGGGDVSINAVRNVFELSAAVAAGQSAVAATGTTSGIQTHYTSGGLAVSAGGDVTTGQFFLADGTGTLSAGQSFAATSISAAQLGQPGGTVNIGSLIGLENSQLSVWAQGDIYLAGAVNPTTLYQPGASGAAANIAFFTYGGNSALSAQSAAGTVTMDNSSAPLIALVGQTDQQGTVELDNGYSILPASLSLRSLTQGLDLSNFAATMFPSANGNLQLFAGGNISGGSLQMSDAPAGSLSIAANATAGSFGVATIANVGTFSPLNFDAGLHINDPNPAEVTAGNNIDGMVLYVPKPAQIEAGNDISNLQYQGQNLNATDQTLIYAGHDFVDPLLFSATGLAIVPTSVVNVGGPGSLDVLAGHDISLGFSGGVTTSGNLQNANLGAGGASVTMLAGLGQSADDADFFKNIIEPSGQYETELVSFVESLTGQTGLSVTQANSAFVGENQLTSNQQRAFIDQVFFNELNQSGLAAGTQGATGYQRGYTAITTLFPGSPIGAAANTSAYSGDLSLTYSQIYTKDGGDISLLVPGGSVNVGLASPPAASANDAKPAAELGIVAEGRGNLNIYALGNVNVNSSRVFTLGGGNILIWSQQGSIDAGNGAKTSLSLPPPTVAYDANGNPYLSFNAAVAGSGIRTIQTDFTEPAGNVDLIAPIGTVNAGDAGIGAAGDINIAAASVVGAANINFGGTATGVPAVVSNVTASVSGAASSASSAANNASSMDQGAGKAEQSAPLAAAALSWLDVFVTGMGDENCKPEDTDCLKRQAHH